MAIGRRRLQHLQRVHTRGFVLVILHFSTFSSLFFFFSVEQATNGVPLDALNGLAAWCLGHSLCCYAFAEEENFRRIEMVIVMVCREIHIHAMWDA